MTGINDLSKYTSFLSDMKSKYASSTGKYKINGKSDKLYESLATAVDDETRQTSLKTKRTKALQSLAAIGDSSVDQKVNATRSRIKYIKETLPILSSISTTGDSKKVAAAVKQYSTELMASLRIYKEAREDGASGNFDAEVINNAKELSKKLTYLMGVEKARIAAASGKVFDASISSAKMSLSKISDLIRDIGKLGNPNAGKITQPSSGSTGSTDGTGGDGTTDGGGIDVIV